MQNVFNNDYRTHYIVEKVLDHLPGNSLEIIDELSKILQNPEALVSSNRSNQLNSIREFLMNADSAAITRDTIQKKIYSLKNQPLPIPKTNYLIKFFKTLQTYFSRLVKRPLCKRGQPA